MYLLITKKMRNRTQFWENKSMENPSKNIKTAQEIKSLLEKKLGIIYSLPEYFFRKGCKAQLMVCLNVGCYLVV